MPKDPLEMQIDVLRTDNDRLSSDIRNMVVMNDKFVSVGITIIGAAFLYGLEKNFLEMYFVAPVALYGLLLFTLDGLRSIAWLSGYKRAVEDKINICVS